VSTMSQAVVDGLPQFRRARIAVATAYAHDGEQPLGKPFSWRKRFEVLALEVSACSASASPTARVRRISLRWLKGFQRGAVGQGLLISLRRVAHAGRGEAAGGAPWHPCRLEHAGGVLAAMRLVGESGHVTGRGRLLEDSATASVH